MRTLESVDAANGYSLPEVMVASTVLALVVANSAGTLTQSGGSYTRSRERDAISALIAKDLEGVRATSFDYKRCNPTAQPGEPAGCAAARLNTFADGQITFVPDAPTCTAGTLAEDLNANTASLTSSANLVIPQSLAGVSLKGVTISRTISASGNELTVKYSSTSLSSGNTPS